MPVRARLVAGPKGRGTWAGEGDCRIRERRYACIALLRLLSIDQSDACDRSYDIAIWSMQTDPPKLEFKYQAKQYENWEVKAWESDTRDRGVDLGRWAMVRFLFAAAAAFLMFLRAALFCFALAINFLPSKLQI